MTAARLKRLARLESRQPSERPWRDPYDAAIRLWEPFKPTGTPSAPVGRSQSCRRRRQHRNPNGRRPSVRP